MGAAAIIIGLVAALGFALITLRYLVWRNKRLRAKLEAEKKTTRSLRARVIKLGQERGAEVAVEELLAGLGDPDEVHQARIHARHVVERAGLGDPDYRVISEAPETRPWTGWTGFGSKRVKPSVAKTKKRRARRRRSVWDRLRKPEL